MMKMDVEGAELASQRSRCFPSGGPVQLAECFGYLARSPPSLVLLLCFAYVCSDGISAVGAADIGPLPAVTDVVFVYVGMA